MGLKAKWIDALPDIKALNGDIEIAEGVEVRLLSGHTRGPLNTRCICRKREMV